MTGDRGDGVMEKGGRDGGFAGRREDGPRNHDDAGTHGERIEGAVWRRRRRGQRPLLPFLLLCLLSVFLFFVMLIILSISAILLLFLF